MDIVQVERKNAHYERNCPLTPIRIRREKWLQE